VLVGTSPTDLYVAAQDLLTAASDACDTVPDAGTTKGGHIVRQYVSPGLPPWDGCPQLTVHVGSAVLGDTAPLQPPLQPGVREGANRAVRLVAFTVTVLRCVPVIGNVGPKTPSPQTISDAAQVIDSDLWAIWNHLAALKRAGLLFPPDKTRVMFFDPAVAVNTSGGTGGWQLQFRVEMPSYPS